MVTSRPRTCNGLLRGASIAALVWLLPAKSARAELLPLDEVVQTMMHTWSSDVFFASLLAGAHDASIEFTTAVDPTARSFSYATRPGQTYGGLVFSISTTGAYNSGLNRYEWVGTGRSGTAEWTTSGSMFWVGDPQGYSVSTYFRDNGREFLREMVIDAFGRGQVYSTMTSTLYEIIGQQRVPLTVTVGTDFWDAVVNDYVLEEIGPELRFRGRGGFIPAPGPGPDPGLRGEAVATLEVLPEPTTLLLVATGLLGGGVAARRRRWCSAGSAKPRDA